MPIRLYCLKSLGQKSTRKDNMKYTLLVLLLWSSTSFGQSINFKHLRLLEVDHLSSEFWHTENYRDPYLPEYSTTESENSERWVGGTAVNFDVNIVRYKRFQMYWDNQAHTDLTTSQVRHVGWEYELGFSFYNKLQLYKYHHSEHCMECDPEQRFPLKDTYGVRFIFFDRDGNVNKRRHR